MSIDKEKALALYKKAADLNDAFAQYNLGCLYLAEKEHPELYHEELAISYFKKSANQGYSNASFKLGKIYLAKSEETIITEKVVFFRTIALKYLEKAASESNTNAQFYLSGVYENKNSKPNKVRSNYWLKQACSNNHLIACKKLMQLAVN